MALHVTAGRRLMLAAAAAGLVVRLVFGLLYWVDKPLTHDEREYLALAQGIATGRGFTYGQVPDAGTTQQFGRAPAYPVFLAAIGAGRAADADAAPVAVKVAQSVVGAAGVWLIGWLAARLAGPAAGAAGAAIAAVYPPLVWICAYVLTEALYSTLALATVALLDVALDRGSRRSGAITAAAGIATGLCILVRPAMVFFVPLAAAWLARHARRAAPLVFIVATFAVVAPWTIRNVRVYDRFVFVASEGGVTFWTGNHPLARGEGDLAANPPIKLAEIEFRRQHPGLSAEQLEPLYYADALRYIAAHPVWWIALLARKAFYTIVPVGPSYTLHSTLYFAASIASYLALLPFAVYGAYAARRRPHPPDALVPLAVSAVIVCLVFFPQERFRIPVIDPALIVCAAIGVAARTGSTRAHRI